MDWKLTPVAVAFLFAAIPTAFAGSLVWQKRGSPGRIPLALLMFSLSIWSFANALESAFQRVPGKVFASQVAYLGVTTSPVLLLIFALSYAQMDDWLTRRKVAALFTIPAITLLLTWTNALHHLVWSGFTPISGRNLLVYHYGPWFWVNVSYTYSALSIATILLLMMVLRQRQIYRRQTAALLFSLLLPFITSVAYVFKFFPIPGIDPVPLAFIITSFAILFGIYRYQLFDLLPVARDSLIEQMDEGVLIIDEQNRVVEANPAAVKLLGLSEAPIGKTIPETVQAHPGLATWLSSPREGNYEFATPGASPRWIEARLSTFQNRRARVNGKLLTLRDLTAHRQTEDALRISEERYRTLIDTSPDGVCLTDLQGQITFISPRLVKILGYEQAENLLNRPALSFAIAEDQDQLRHFVQSLQQQNRQQAIEYRGICRDGSSVDVEANCEILRDPSNGEPSGLFFMIREIGERKRAEQAEQKARQVAEALRETAVDINAALDFEELLNRSLEQIERVIHYDSASITLLEGSEFHLVTLRGFNHPQELRGLRFPVSISPNLHVIETRSPVRVANIPLEYPTFLQPPERTIRSWLGIPLFAQGEAIGTLNLDSEESDHFSAEDQRLGEIFAAQVSVALANSRLYSEVKHRAVEQSILNEIMHIIASRLDLQDLLKAIDEQIIRFLHTPIFLIAFYEPPKESWQVLYVRDNASAWKTDATFALNNGLTGYVIQQNKPLFLPTPASIQTFLQQTNRKNLGTIPSSSMGVPLNAGGRLIGAMMTEYYEPDRSFSSADFTFFQQIGQQVAVALQNALLYTQLEQLAMIDMLTGLYNRRQFFSLAKNEFARARRFEKSMAVMMVDIDHFKVVNDTYGHAAGDRVLQSIAQVCRQTLRQMDLSGRYGGEEFVFLLPETSLTEAFSAANRLCKVIANHVTCLPQGEVRITISLGVAALHPDDEQIETVLDRADQALYAAKQAGRDCAMTEDGFSLTA